MAITPVSLEDGSPEDHLKSVLSSEIDGGVDHEGAIQRGIASSIGLPLEFRVVRPGAPVRRLRLTGNRYTFGSGEGCSIRLDDESLRPMHAVLLRDAHRILMRAYSIPLECNGTRTTESVLKVGDIIRMGNYRFELLAAPGLIDLQGSPGPSAGSLHTSTSNKNLHATEGRESQLRDRLTELSQQWHARHAECEVRESRCDQRESELHGRETELWSRSENLQHRESLLVAQEAAAREIQETYAATQNELKSLRLREVEASEALQEKEAELLQKSEQLRERQSELEQRQAEWQEREEQYAERAAEAQRKLEQTQQQAQSASDAVGRMREEFASLNEQLTELRERHSELQERERREQGEHERLRGEVEAERDQALDQRAKSEAEGSEAENELQRATADLESTREELAKIRQESKACQLELSDKLRATGEELQATREESEKSRRAAEEEHAYTEKKILELEERLARVQENRDGSDTEARAEIAALFLKRQAAEEARKSAEEGRRAAEETRQIAEEAQQIAEDARQNAEQALQSSENGRREAEEGLEGAEVRLQAAGEELEAAEDRRQAAEDRLKDALEGLKVAEDGRQGAEQAAQELRTSIHQLQESVAEANQEAMQLRVDYEGANASVRQLELLVDQTKNNQTSQYESWEHESEQLRLTIEELSVQLSSANAELGQLRSANEALSSELASSHSNAEGQIANQQTAIDSEQFGFLQQELDSARQEIERLQDTHAETVTRLESERQESESALRDEIEQLREEIASAQQAAQARIQQITDSLPSSEVESIESFQSEDQSDAIGNAESQDELRTRDHSVESQWAIDAEATDSLPEGEFETATSAETSTDQLVESGDSVWRMESEQAVENSGHLSAPSEEQNFDSSVDESASDWSTSDWSKTDHSADAAIDPEEQNEASVSWHDEPPEHAVADAIDDIEHNVQQAISGYDKAADSILPGKDADDDTPLNWSAYMPGGAIDELPDEPVDAQPQNELEPLDPGQSADILEQAPLESDEPAESEHIESNSWSMTLADSDAIQHPFSQNQDLTEHAEEEPEDDSPEAISSSDRLPIEEIGQTTGSLADMLIRDLTSDNDDGDVGLREEIDAGTDRGEAVDYEATFVMNNKAEFAGDVPHDESETWNSDSPERRQEDSISESDIDASDQFAAHETDHFQTAFESGSDTVPVPQDDSIEAYMSRLLQRVQSDDETLPESNQPGLTESGLTEPGLTEPGLTEPGLTESGLTESGLTEPGLAEPETSQQSDDLDSEGLSLDTQRPTEHSFDSSASVELPEPENTDAVSMVPLSQAPELEKSLSAMRELANQSARNAVARSIRVQARDTQMKAAFKCGLAICFVAMAVGVVILVNLSFTIKIAMVGAFLVLAAVFGQEGYVLVRDARRRLKLAENSASGLKDEQVIAEEIHRVTDEIE